MYMRCSGMYAVIRAGQSLCSIFGVGRLRSKTRNNTWRNATSANTLDNCISTPRAMHFACVERNKGFEKTARKR